MPTVRARASGAGSADAGLLALALSRPREALDAATAVLAAPSDARSASVAWQATGIVLRDRGDLDEALVALRRARAAARRAGDPERAADVRATLGAALVMAGRTSRGLSELQSAAAAAHGVPLAKVRLRWAHVLTLLGRHDEAVPLLNSAVAVFRRAGDLEWEARGRHNRCMCHLAGGATQRAAADAAQAEALFRRLGQDLEAAQAVHNQALAAHQAGDLPAALRLLAQARSAYRRIGVSPADLAIDEAAVRLTAGLVDEAVDGLTAALAGPTLQPVKRAEVQLAAAAARLAVGGDSAGSARELAATAAAEFRRQDRGWWARRAELVVVAARVAAGERSAALLRTASDLADSAALGQPQDAALAHLLAGRLAVLRGDRDRAQAQLQAAGRCRRAGAPLTRATGWLAEALRDSAYGSGAGVLRACRAGLDALDDHRRTLGDPELRALATGHGRELADLALRAAMPRGPRALLHWAERWRATALDAAVGPADRDRLGPELAALRDVVRRLDAARAAGEPYAHLERQRQAREGDLRRRRRALPGSGPAAGGMRVADLVAALGPTALVELVVVGGELYAVVARAGRVRRVHVGPLAAAEQEVDFARFALRRAAHGRAPALDPVGSRLQEALLGQAPRLLPEDAGPVVVVPPGRLHAVPWGLLPALRERPVGVAPSAQAWLRARRTAPPAPRRVALVSGPDLGTGGAEVPPLSARYGTATVLRDGAATVDAALGALDGAWLGHVAAHGVFRADSPLFSCLQLADGPLLVHDLERLRRAPYRLVLSACDTGVAAAVGSDEVLGIVSGLLAVGTAEVVASVTPVNDEATVPVMLALHAALAGGADLAHALLAARRATAGEPTAAATAAAFLAFGGSG